MINVRLTSLLSSLYLISCASLPSFGQSEVRIDCGSVAKLSKPKSHRIFSLGVINGKAIDLVKPDYPAAARAVGAYGSVEISILIDTRGCVNDAKPLSGHPLLVPASLRAAIKSRFSPTTLSDNPIWVYGIIQYNYVPASLNWFQLGLVSDSSEKLIEYLPPGFDLQRNALRETKSVPYDEKQKAMAGVLNGVRMELAAEPKQQWLFEVGRKINDISRFNWTGPEGLKEQTHHLESLLERAPHDVSPSLVSVLQKLITETDAGGFWKRIKDIEFRSFYLGK